jgi:hypothetical protein
MRQRMVLQNLSPRTIVSYLNGPRQLIRYYNTPPHEITSDQILSYLVYLKEEKQQKRNTMRIAVNGIRYLYKHFLNRPEICDQIPYPKAERYDCNKTTIPLPVRAHPQKPNFYRNWENWPRCSLKNKCRRNILNNELPKANPLWSKGFIQG